MAGDHDAALRRFEERRSRQETAEYVLTLFVTGASEMSARAISNVRTLCELYLEGRYRLEVVDIHRDAELTAARDVLAAPTLIKDAPLPVRRLVGDLSDTARVLAALDIRVAVPAPRAVPGR